MTALRLPLVGAETTGAPGRSAIIPTAGEAIATVVQLRSVALLSNASGDDVLLEAVMLALACARGTTL